MFKHIINHITKDYSSFLEDTGKNLHITHIDDLIIDSDVNEVISILNKIVDKKIDLTYKIDGLPFVAFGQEPQTKKFCIGTKRIATRPAFSLEDIQKIYEDIPELQDILSGLFKILSTKRYNKIFAGDLVWSPRNPKTTEGDSITFKPNTIKYSVPSDSDLASNMEGKDFGMIIHTSMTGGPTFKDMNKSNKVELGEIGDTPNLWLSNAQLNKYSNTETLDLSDFKNEINELKKYDTSIKDLPFKSADVFSFFVKANNIKKSTEEKLNLFRDFMISKINSKVPTTVEAKTAEINTVFENNKDKIRNFIILNEKILEVKQKIIEKLTTSMKLKTSHNFEGTFVDNKGEGFVAVDGDRYVKLVDREEFSAMNSLNWGRK